MSKFLVSYSTLLSLRKNLPDDHDIEEKYIVQYHDALALIEKELTSEHFNANDFRIPSSEIRNIPTGGNYVTGETFYSDERFCEKALLLTKLDASLNYLAMISTGEDKNRIMGFQST